MVFILKVAVKSCKRCNVAFCLGQEMAQPSSAQVKRTLGCCLVISSMFFPFLKQEGRDHFH